VEGTYTPLSDDFNKPRTLSGVDLRGRIISASFFVGFTQNLDNIASTAKATIRQFHNQWQDRGKRHSMMQNDFNRDGRRYLAKMLAQSETQTIGVSRFPEVALAPTSFMTVAIADVPANTVLLQLSR
jgi:hypothetical protein